MEKHTHIPSSAEVQRELTREEYKRRYHQTLRSTVFVLITAAAAAILVATLWMPVLRIYGSSMTPTLEESEIVVSLKLKNFEQGDIIAFYYGNQLLVKRCIAGPGDWVEITEDGTVYVNGTELAEPYLTEKALGICDLQFPYQVPDGKYFLMGDHRETSIDSRHSTVGCVAADQIVGKIVYRIWPAASFGSIE